MRKLLAALIFFGLSIAASAQSPVVPSTITQIPIVGTVAASTRIITGVAGKQIYVTALLLVPTVAGSVVTFTYGTGTNCGTGTQSITGALTFPTTEVLTHGSGYGAIFVLPRGTDLCITIAAQAAPGSMAYAIF